MNSEPNYEEVFYVSAKHLANNKTLGPTTVFDNKIPLPSTPIFPLVETPQGGFLPVAVLPFPPVDQKPVLGSLFLQVAAQIHPFGNQTWQPGKSS